MYIPPQSVPCGLLCLVAFHIRRGRYCLFSFSGFTRASIQGISKSKVPRFLFIFTGGQEPTSHKLYFYEKIIIACSIIAVFSIGLASRKWHLWCKSYVGICQWHPHHLWLRRYAELQIRQISLVFFAYKHCTSNLPR